MSLKIDKEFEACCRKLTSDEEAILRDSLRDDGCINPILVWDRTIIDGHNRYRICRELGIDFRVAALAFSDRDEAMLWVINHQLGRRNLSELDRVALLEQKRPILERQAKERQRMSEGPGQKGLVNLPNLSQKTHVRDQLAAEAGVSGRTYDHLRAVPGVGGAGAPIT